jgi:hypothetical protein
MRSPIKRVNCWAELGQSPMARRAVYGRCVAHWPQQSSDARHRPGFCPAPGSPVVFAFLASKGRAERRACHHAREGLPASWMMHAGERGRSTGTGPSPAFRTQRFDRLATPSSASAGALTKCGHRRIAGSLGRPPTYAGTSLLLWRSWPRRRPAYAMGPSHPLRAVTYTASFNWSG